MVELNLPEPSSELMNAITSSAPAPLGALDQSSNFDSLFSRVSIYQIKNPKLNNVNIAIGIYFTNEIIKTLGQQEYCKYFPGEDMVFSCLFLRNTRPGIPASLPPHSDKKRLSGLQFPINSGGPNVRTVFYNKFESYNDLNGGDEIYDNLTVDKEYPLNDSKWYGLDTVQYHSVEHIETDRILLSISLINISLPELKKKYNDLII